MSWVTKASLLSLHAFYFLWTCLKAVLHKFFSSTPQPLEYKRKKLPTHLALLLADIDDDGPSESSLNAVTESVCSAVRWCGVVGIKTLSIYDRKGYVLKCAERIRVTLLDEAAHEQQDVDNLSDSSDLEFPLTPPSSVSSNSRPLSPQNWKDYSPTISMQLDMDTLKPVQRVKGKRHHVKRRRSSVQVESSARSDDAVATTSWLTLLLTSYDASKPAMARISRLIATSQKSLWKPCQKAGTFQTSVGNVDVALQDFTQIPPPELLIVHSIKLASLQCPPVELHGFPPWPIRLTEIYHDNSPTMHLLDMSKDARYFALPEETFRRALDEYASAEMRLGK